MASSEAARLGVFDRISPDYDRKLWFDENVFLINFRRWRLLSHVQGDVLEVAAGTGRNLTHYQYYHRMQGLCLCQNLFKKIFFLNLFFYSNHSALAVTDAGGQE